MTRDPGLGISLVLEPSVSCSHSCFLWGSAGSSHGDGCGNCKHPRFPRQAGGRDVPVCLPGDDRPWGLGNKGVRAGMAQEQTGWGKGREKVVTGTPGLLLVLLLLSLSVVFLCQCNGENVTRPQFKVNGQWLKSDTTRKYVKLLC